MRVTALVLSILGVLAVVGGLFFYAVGSALICVDVCPPVASAGPQVAGVFAFTLGPGLLLTLAATVVALLAARGRPWSLTTIALVASPFVAAVAGLVILLLVGGSLAPVAAGPTDVPLASRQVAIEWMSATTYAATPLLLWPLAALVAAIAVVRRGSPPS